MKCLLFKLLTDMQCYFITRMKCHLMDSILFQNYSNLGPHFEECLVSNNFHSST